MKTNKMSQKIFWVCSILIALAIISFISKEIYLSFERNQEHTSHTLMTYVDGEGNLTFSTNFVPEKMEYKQLFSYEEEIVLSVSDEKAKDYKIVCGGTYTVGTSCGDFASFFTILESRKDGAFYISPDEIFSVNPVVHGNLKSPALTFKKEKISCFPVRLKNQSEIIQRAGNHIFESLRCVDDYFLKKSKKVRVIQETVPCPYL